MQSREVNDGNLQPPIGDGHNGAFHSIVGTDNQTEQPAGGKEYCNDPENDADQRKTPLSASLSTPKALHILDAELLLHHLSELLGSARRGIDNPILNRAMPDPTFVNKECDARVFPSSVDHQLF